MEKISAGAAYAKAAGEVAKDHRRGLVTAEVIARLLGLTEHDVSKFVTLGWLPAVKIHDTVRFSIPEVVAHLENEANRLEGIVAKLTEAGK